MPILTCPTCGRRVVYREPGDAAYRPFCCERCQMVDLGKWLTEAYRISGPVDAPPAGDEAPPAAGE